jgi:GNAT superfamily N-acetyltransferase
MPDATALRLSVRNAAAFWAAIARTRQHELVQRQGFLAVVGDERAGLRVLILQPRLDREAREEIDGLVAGHRALPTWIEDQFATADFSHLGLAPISLPVMHLDDAPAAESEQPTDLLVEPVGAIEQLRAAEDVVVHGFPLTRMQPLVPGTAFPDDLLWYPGVRLFLATRDGRPVGACLTVDEGTCGGIYWVTTSAEHRSSGVGRSVMLAALGQLASSPVSLTATAAGEPLYESLGFSRVATAAWWM